MLGRGVHLSANAIVTTSVLARNCVVGEGARVSQSYCFDDVSLGAACVVDRAIIGAGARIGRGAVIGRGCVVGDGVVVGDGFHMPPFSRVGLKACEPDAFDR